MKRKLFLLLALMLGFVSSIQARTDVTSTYLTDAALDNETNNWALSSSGGNHPDPQNGYHESWHNTFTITQTTAALPAGYYQLSIQVAVEGGNSTTISLQATSGSNTSVAAYPKYSTHSSWADMAAWWKADADHTGNRNLSRIFTTVYVEEGQTLTATFKQTANNQWFVYGQMQLHMLTDEEGRNAQIFEAVYNPMTNLDMASNRYKQRFESYTAGTVTGKKLNKTISGLPKGKYNVTLNGGASYTSGRGFDGNTGDNLTDFFANNATTNVTVVDRTGIGNLEFTDYTASGGLVTDGNLEVGFNNLAIGANWFVGSVKYIELAEPYISYIAIEIPAATETALTANGWYKFIPASTGDYAFTTTTVGDIIYTTTDQLPSTATGTTATAVIELTEGTTYYIKSSSAQTLTISPQNFTYTVGSATASVSYIQKDNTVTVSYNDLYTDNPSPTLVKDFSGVTFGGDAIAFTPTANGFTFTVPTVTAATEYTLAIPANAIGYSDGDGTYNEAQNITLNVPVLFDGIYYFKVENETAAKGKYLSRGNVNGVHATVDFYGIPVQVATNGNNETTLQLYDSKQYYVHSGNWDCNANGATADAFTITLNEGRYRIHNNKMDAGRYFKYNTSAVENIVMDVYDDGDGTNSGPIIDWSIETPSEHKTVLGTYTAKNYTNVINDASLAVTANEFVAYLVSNYAAKDKTSSVGTAKITNAAGDWTWTGAREQNNQPAYDNAAEAWQATGSWSQTIEDLPSGIYKVTVNAFERDGGWSLCNTLGAEGYEIVTSYFKANDEQVQLKSWYSEKEGTNNPNSMSEAATAFNNDKYKSEVYTYVADEGSGTGSLVLTIAKPGHIGDNWLLWNNVTLTYYDSSVSDEDATAILAEAATTMDSPMKPSLYQALATAEATFDGARTVPNYNALRTAIDNCATSIASYASMKTNYLDRIESLLASTNVYSTSTTEYTSYVDYKSKYDNYKNALTADIENATANSLNAYSGDKGTRPVDLILMPSWTIGGEATGNKFYQNTWSDEGAGDGTNFLLPFYEYWVPGEQILNATTLQATQTGLTANGIYKVSAWVRVQESSAGTKINNGITMQVGDGTSVDVSAGEKIGETSRYIGEYTAVGQADGDGNLTITFTVADGSNISWLAFKNLNYEKAPADIPVEFGASGFATFACDYPVALPDNESIKGYTASISGKTITFNKITDKVVPANTGVMLSGTVNTTMYLPVAAADAPKSSDFIRGTGSALGADDDNYYFAIKKSASDLTFGTFNPESVVIATNKAYFTIAKNAIGNARLVISFNDDDDPTAINSIEAAAEETEGLEDGKYLIDGQIIIVKNGVKYSANGQILK